MLTDQAARDAITGRVGDNAFVEAGAGSGKTSCLVDRFVALVESGVEADAIAAITFTEKAAEELVGRTRRALQDAAATSERAARALGAVDGAAISTLHAFAQRLLSEHPLEAGLPPRVVVLDEIASDLRFAERWEQLLGALLDDPDAVRLLGLLFAGGAKVDQLRQVAVAFNDNWDLVAERRSSLPSRAPLLDVTGVLHELDAVVALAGECTDPDDKLCLRLDSLREWGDAVRGDADDQRRFELMRDPPSCAVTRLGRAGNWPSIGVIRDAVAAFGERLTSVCAGVTDRCLGALAEHIAGATVEAADERRADGELEFHDLLVLARNLLRHPDHGWAVRQQAAARYQRLLIDEYQDTDPIQAEIAFLLASDDPDAGAKPWRDIPVADGRLCLVGDPKQSIYRFRRADIGVFLDSRAALGADVHPLTTNFRSGEGVVEWVNGTFSSLIVEGPGQPGYVPLDPHRPAPPSGPSVSYLGASPLPSSLKADDVREIEADSVAQAVATVVASSWPVGAPGGGWRPAGWSDIAILLPARTSLRMLERALEELAVPYRVETSSLVYGTTEVRELLIVARAIEDPTDELAVVAALRTSAFGCGDDDLYRWKSQGGRWDHQAPPLLGAAADDPVLDGMEWLRVAHRSRAWRTPSEVLASVIRDRRLMEVATVHPRPRDLWRRLRFVLDQCRAWEEAGGETLRAYLAWVGLQSAEGARVIETVLPETDDSAVRILTVHGAKGLEFPLTVLSGLTTQLVNPPRGVEVRFPPGGGWSLKLTNALATAEWELNRPLDEQLDRAERVRLLYVAATRAVDHLVVSMHRKEAPPGKDPADTAAQVLADAGMGAGGAVPFPFAGPEALDGEAAERRSHAAVPSFGSKGVLGTVAEWQASRDEVLALAGRRLVVSATRLAEEAARALADEELAGTADGLRKDARDLDLPPWQKGRYGSVIGRAVHGVLQTIDLSTGLDLRAACDAQAVAEGVAGEEEVIERFCRSALESDLVAEAAAAEHWREVYVGAPRADGMVLEGYIDLLFRRADGLVVVDYKTDRWDSRSALDAKVDRYRVQLHAYVEAVATVTGEAVADAVLLFLSASGDAVAVSV